MESGKLTMDQLNAWYTRVRRARPFLKWAGGKQRFFSRFAEHIPDVAGTYIEPFLGSGSFFFGVMSRQRRPGAALLGDTNIQLIACFEAVKREPERLHQRLLELQHGYDAEPNKSDFYYRQRDLYNKTLPNPDPALLIFLNQTCWNGLYRVNQMGKFNVPYGAPKTSRVIPTLDELLDASAALTQAHLRATTWENTVARAQPGDFVFLDPPYYSDVMVEEGRVTKYRSRPFTLEHHERLARTLLHLEQRGIAFVLTNSAEAEMSSLYRSHGLHVRMITAPRSINSKTERRGAVPELVVFASSLSFESEQLRWVLDQSLPDTAADNELDPA